MTDQPPSEGSRRRHLRYRLDAEVRLRKPGVLGALRAENVRALDFSRYGMSFDSSHAWEEGDALIVRITVGDRSAIAAGTVRWCREQRAGWRIGVAFDDATADTLHILERAVKQQ